MRLESGIRAQAGVACACIIVTLSGSMVSEDEEGGEGPAKWLGETLSPCGSAVRARVLLMVNRQVSTGVSTSSRRWEVLARAPEDGKRVS
tara:strand:- start:394 stop:663 length:270 start_codon:yes stop_codon:yes gene_type:complete